MRPINVRPLASLCLSLLAGSAMLTIGGPCAAADDAHSNAGGLDSVLSYRGESVRVGDVGQVKGRANGAYDLAVSVSSFHEDASGVPVVLGPRIVANAQAISAHAASTGIGVDSISSQADVSIADAEVDAAINPPPVHATGHDPLPPPSPLLTMRAQQVSATTYYTKTFPDHVTANGTTSIGSLKIGGSLLGGQTIKYSGTPVPNTVIYNTGAMTITLNKQVAPILVSCQPQIGCTTNPVSIQTVAIDIELKHVVAYGKVLTGEIRLGTAAAQ